MLEITQCLERALLIGPKLAAVYLILKTHDSEFLYFLAYEVGQSLQKELFK